MKKLILLLSTLLIIASAQDDAALFNKNIKSIPLQSALDRFSQKINFPGVACPEYLQIVGRREVVGYTTYDWQFNGPVYTWCRTDPIANGIHISWMYSEQPPATWPDRNQRYNFYDFTTRTWSFLPDGVNIFLARSGFGGFDYDPVTGCWHCCTHQSIGGQLTPVAGRDLVAGGGLFGDTTIGPTAHQWPPCAITVNQAIHIAMIRNIPGTKDLWYSRIQPWGTWSSPVRMQPPPVDSIFPSHNIAASKTSNKVIITWVDSYQPIRDSGYYRLSTNGGIDWSPSTMVPFPPAFSDISGAVAAFHISGFYGMFDNNDNLHLVATVWPIIDDSLTIRGLTEIWHYCPANTPNWTRIYRYAPSNFPSGGQGYNALSTCRPSIVQQPGTSNFYVAWEQFDSLNIEPTTNLCRADIYIARSANNGLTWTKPLRITRPDSTSKRFPCLGGVVADTIILAYEIDSIAGFVTQNQGRYTRNPIICHRLHKIAVDTLPIAIEEPNLPTKYYPFALNPAVPNPSKLTTSIAYSISTTAKVDLTIYDVLGRPVKTLVSEVKAPGEYTVLWDGRTDTGKKAEAGVYFYTLKTADKTISQKLVRTN